MDIVPKNGEWEKKEDRDIENLTEQHLKWKDDGKGEKSTVTFF